MKTLKLVLTCALIFCVSVISAQTKHLTGIISDENGEPIIGASVMLKGTTIGTVTDVDGRFSLNVPEDGILVISYIGYQSQEVPVTGLNTLNVVLQEDTELLDEVVVIGYGSVRRSDLTGAVSSVSMPVVQASGQTNTYGGMTGTVSGVNIIRNNNKPGGTFDINIRGLSSISGTNAPLVVVDGIPVPTVSGTGQTGNTSGLETINPDDIEKIDILKDASSTAIYGSRASNGVIIVTTKRGAEGKPRITYSGYGGWRSYTNVPEMMSGDEWVQLARESYRALNNNVYRKDEEIFTNPSELKAIQDHNYFDWLDAVSNPAFITNHSIQASGGTEMARYLFSGGYYFEDGMVNPQDFTRYTMRSAVDMNISRHIDFGGNLYLTYSTRNTGNSDLALDALRHRPTEHPYSLVDGSEQWNFSGSGTFNSLIANHHEFNQTKSINLLGNVYLAITPIEGLEFRSSFSPRLQKDLQGQFRGTWTRANRGTNKPTSNYRKNDYTDFVWDNIINYQWSRNIHNLNLTGVYSMQQNVMEGLYGLGNTLSFNSLWYNVQGGQTNSSQSSYSQSSLMSYLARANYSLMDKYLFTASFRYDGSSKLAEGNKWGFFPSAAIAWRISEEAFMQNLRWLSNLKLRLSYGQTGNDSVGPYSTAGTISGSQYIVFGESGTGMVGTVPGNLRNTRLSWERSTEYNFGIDLGIFDSRFTTSIELYDRLTTDLIMSRSVPITTGYSSVRDNVGAVRNRGIEMTFNTVNVRTRDFQWTTNLNLAYNKNEIHDLVFKEDLGVYSDQLEGMVGDFSNRWFIGEPIQINWRYQTLGVWQLGEESEAAKYGQKPGQYRVRDWNNDGVLNDNDRHIYGKRTPDWIGGMTNVFNYKNFDFSFNMYFQTGAINNSPFYVSFALEANNHNFNNIKKDYWTPENPTHSSAQPSNMGSYRNEGTHSYFKTDFLKVGFATLGYTFPHAILRNFGVSQFRVYCTVQNPFTFTNYIGFDPGQSININASDFMTRNTLLGVNVSF